MGPLLYTKHFVNFLYSSTAYPPRNKHVQAEQTQCSETCRQDHVATCCTAGWFLDILDLSIEQFV